MKDPWKIYKSMCCKAQLVRVARADYRCSKCNADETMSYLYYAQAVEEENLKKLIKDEQHTNSKRR